MSDQQRDLNTVSKRRNKKTWKTNLKELKEF